MRSRQIPLLGLITLHLLGSPFVALARQDSQEAPASQPLAAGGETKPASRPAAVGQPQRTPQATLREFLQAVSDSEDRPERIMAAVDCLDLNRIDPESTITPPELAQQLAGFIDTVFRLTGKSTADAPNTPSGSNYVLYELQGHRIELAQYVDGRWRFTAESLASVVPIEQAWRTEPTTQQALKQKETSAAPAEYRSPRATMATFRRALDDGDAAAAAQCMDTSRLDESTRSAVSVRLARRLREVIDRLKPVVLQDIPDSPEGDRYTFYLGAKGRVEFERQDAGPRHDQWLFSAATVASIDALYKSLEDQPTAAQLPSGATFWSDPTMWIRAHVPPEFKREVLGLAYWQWLGLLTVTLSGILIQRISVRVLPLIAALMLTREQRGNAARMRHIVVPAASLLMVLTWWGGVSLLDLSAEVLTRVLLPLQVLLTLAAIWSVYRLTDLVLHPSVVQLAPGQTRFNEVLVPLLRKAAKVLIVCLGGVLLLMAAGFNVMPLLAGLGLGGLAFGLAAQDTLKSFFGSVNVVLDRPFQVGDWVRIGAYEGKVESVGLRSSRIRTFENSELTIPNSDLMNSAIDNMGRRPHRRLRTILAVAYATPVDRLEAFLDGIRQIIHDHPSTLNNDFQAYVQALTPTSVEVMVNCNLDAPNWDSEMRVRHELLMRILRLAGKLGIELTGPARGVTPPVDGHPVSKPLPPGTVSPAPVVRSES